MNRSRVFCLLAVLLLTTGFTSVLQAAGPEYAYETTIPGYWLSSGRGMTVDLEGNSYVIAPWYQDHTHLDILITKLNPEGSLVWSLSIIGDTYEHDYATDITVDSKGDVWVTGWTSSESFPIVNGLDDSLTGFRDAFVMKLAAEDGTILYSTLLGGDYTDEGRGIVLNDADEIYVVGSTGSTDFPTTGDAYQDHPSAPLYIYTDAFITKLSADGNQILYSTYFGGFEDDGANHVALDSQGNIVISGMTTAADFPLVDPIQSTPNDIFVAKLSADGSGLMFGTYLGGDDLDYLRGMTIDSAGSVYLTGQTRSIDFPTTAGAFQEDFVGEILGCGSPPYDPLRNCEDGFVTKLGTDGGGLVFSTFLGGNGVDECHDIAIDAVGSPIVIGYTSSPDFPGSDEDGASIVVSKLNPSGSDLLYTVAKRSGSANAGHGIAVDAENDIYVTGAINVPAEIYVAKITDDGSGVAGLDGIGGSAALSITPGFPNPFRGSTRLSYNLPGDGISPVALTIYDASGRLVRTLVDEPLNPGPHIATWDGTNHAGASVPGGVYFYRLRSAGVSRGGSIRLVR